MIRPEIMKLIALGQFPVSRNVDLATIKRQEELLRQITPPLSDEEAKEMMKLFGPDDYFGLAWAVLHLVEGAPNWPLQECMSNASNEWIARLTERAKKSGA